MKKENNIEVARTVRFKLIGTYDIGDGFYVDIVLDRETQMYDYWLYNKDYDIKIVCIKLPKYPDYKGFKAEMIKNCRDAERYLDYILSENYKTYYRDKYMQD